MTSDLFLVAMWFISSKLLASRIKSILPLLIGDNQNEFLGDAWFIIFDFARKELEDIK